MDDEYTQMKRELEEIEATAARLRYSIRALIERLKRSDHPLRIERIAQLEQLRDCLT